MKMFAVMNVRTGHADQPFLFVRSKPAGEIEALIRKAAVVPCG